MKFVWFRQRCRLAATHRQPQFQNQGTPAAQPNPRGGKSVSFDRAHPRRKKYVVRDRLPMNCRQDSRSSNQICPPARKSSPCGSGRERDSCPRPPQVAILQSGKDGVLRGAAPKSLTMTRSGSGSDSISAIEIGDWTRSLISPRDSNEAKRSRTRSTTYACGGLIGLIDTRTPSSSSTRSSSSKKPISISRWYSSILKRRSGRLSSVATGKIASRIGLLT